MRVAAPTPRRLLVFGMLGVLGACHEDPTQLVVWLETDLDRPDELDAFRTHVGAPGAPPGDERAFVVSGSDGAARDAVTLPASFGVAPRGGDAARRVEIAIDAVRNGSVLFTTRAITGFVEHERMRLDLFLAERCIEEHEACEREGRTCGRRGCIDVEVPTSDLAPWTGPPDAGAVADAGPDAAPPDAAATDAAVGDGGEADATVDSGVEPLEPWARTVIAGARTLTPHVVADGAGAAYVLASFGEELDIAGQQLRPDGTRDLLVLAFDSAGEPVGAEQHGAAGGSITVWDVAWDGADGVLVAGSYSGDLAVVDPGFVLPAGGSGNGFVGRIRTSDLSLAWVVPFVSTVAAAVNAVAVSPAGVFVAGDFTDDIGAGSPGVPLPGEGAFAAGLTADGRVGCLERLTSASFVRGTGAMALPERRFAVSGRFSGDLVFGDGSSVDLEGPVPASFVAVYDELCARQDDLTETWNLQAVQVAPRSGGDGILLAGASFSDQLIGGQIVPVLGRQDVAVVALEANLSVVAGRQHGGDDRDEILDLEGLDGRDPLVAGFTRGTASFGPLAELPPLEGTSDGYAVALGDDGLGLWALSAQGASSEAITSAVWDPARPSVFVTGSFASVATVGGLLVDVRELGNIVGPSGVFLARLSPP